MKHIHIRLGLPFFTLFFTFFFGQNNLPAQNGEVESYLVKFNPQASPLERERVRLDFGVTNLVSNTQDPGYEHWQVPGTHSRIESLNRENLIKDARENGVLLRIEPNYSFDINIAPNDPFWDQQWGMENSGQNYGVAGKDIGLGERWQDSASQKPIIVGFIDTGTDYRHKDLKENIWQNLKEDADGDGHTIEWINDQWQLDPGDIDHIDADSNGYVDDLVGWDFINDDNDPFDDHGHGTHVAGIAGAITNNGIGISGVNGHLKIMSLKAFDENGIGSLASILPALAYARNMEVPLTNNSWGSHNYSEFLEEEIELALEAQQIMVVAAGNHGQNIEQSPVYPAAYKLDNIISVGAFNRQGAPSSFSNYGSYQVDLFAPGEAIFSTTPGNDYGFKSGTSMATPFVTGALSLIMANSSGLDIHQMSRIILSNVVKEVALSNKCLSGGRLDIGQSLDGLKKLCTEWEQITNGIEIYSLVEQEDFIWAGTDKGLLKLNKRDCSLTIYNDHNSPLPKKKHKIKSVVIDQNGTIWLASDGKGLFSFDGSNWQAYNKKNSGLPYDKINDLFIDQHNKLWMGLNNAGLASYDGQSWNAYKKYSSGLPDNHVNGIIEDSFGRLWICTDKGLTAYDGQNWIVYNKNNSGLHKEKLYDLMVGPEGKIWVTTDKGGIGIMGPNGWEVLRKENTELPDNNVLSLSFDGEGDKWLGTKKGLAILRDSSWTIIKKNNSNILHNQVNDIAMESGRYAWVGTKEGLSLFIANFQAHFQLEGSACLGDTLICRNLSSGNATYRWEIDGVEVSQEQDLSLPLTSAGTISIRLYAQSSFGTETFSREIVVLSPPTLTHFSDTTICAEAVSLEAGPSGIQYQWSLNGVPLDTSRVISTDQSGLYLLEAQNQCQQISRDSFQLSLIPGCVWPGDVNANGRVNIVDFLSLAEADSMTGLARAGIDTSYTGYPVNDWHESFAAGFVPGEGANLKHADCDGNGIVSISQDALFIRKHANYPPSVKPDSSGTSFEWNLHATSMHLLGHDSLLLEYEFDVTGPQQELAGIAFEIAANVPLSSDPILSFDSTQWEGAQSLVLHLPKAANANPQLSGGEFNKMEIGIILPKLRSHQYARMPKVGIIIVVEDLSDDPLLMNFTNLQLNMVSPIFLGKNGKYLPVLSQSSNLMEAIPEDIQLPNSDLRFETGNLLGLRIYPNPASDYVKVQWQSQLDETGHIRLIDLTARQIGRWPISKRQIEMDIPLSNLPPGIYVVEIQTRTLRGRQILLVQ